MIVFDLRCSHDHVFEGWFGSSDDYRDQQARGLLACPMCHCADITRTVSAAAVPAKGNRSSGTPAEIRARLAELARLQAEVESRCDYVGDRFAAEARRLHALPAPVRADQRGICGEATADEARELVEDGIPIAPLPFRSRRSADA
ncbi:MAG: DUF1178 family protein [Thermaurantiacus sp.]